MEEKQSPDSSSAQGKLSLWRRALMVAGLEARAPLREVIRVKVKRRLLILALLILFVFLCSFGTIFMYSTSPQFCNTCHIMKPYYNAWNTSSHNFVSCVDCHYPPGKPRAMLWYKFQALSQVTKYVTRTYSTRPFADIEDASCLRGGCHQTRLIQGRVVTKNGIVFDHQPHLEKIRHGMQLRCVSCHSQIVIGTHIEVTWDSCYLCHFLGHIADHKTELKGGCQKCHQVPAEPIKIGKVTVNHKDYVNLKTENCQDCHRDLLIGDGAVDRDRCFTCHNLPEKLNKFNETEFIHLNHVTRHHVACFHCHRETRHGFIIAKDAKTLASECHKCHTSMHDLEFTLYQGVGIKEVPDTPSPMYLAGVDCVGCHSQSEHPGNHLVSNATTYTGSQVSCSVCHGKEYLGMVPIIQNSVDETVRKLTPKYNAVQSAMKTKKLDPELKKAIQEKLDNVNYDLNFVKSAPSVHNIYYVAEILYSADKILTAAAQKLGIKVEDASRMPIISGAYCATLCHNRLGLESPPRIVRYKSHEFEHDWHLKQGLNCRACHTFGVHKDIKVNEQACINCHGEDFLK